MTPEIGLNERDVWEGRKFSLGSPAFKHEPRFAPGFQGLRFCGILPYITMKLRLPLFLLLLAPALLAGETYTGECVGVTDGDTISVMHAGKAVKIRLEGIDSPEMGQDFGTRAKQFTSALVFGKDVEVKEYYLDRYGRMVARVLEGGQDVSLELVKAGVAWHFKKYSSDPVLAGAEEEARTAKWRLWSITKPSATAGVSEGAGEAGGGRQSLCLHLSRGKGHHSRIAFMNASAGSA